MKFLQGFVDYSLLQRRFYRYSKKSIETMQLGLIRNIVAKAEKDSPFYRQLYQGRMPGSLEEFQGFPSIDKQVMMDNFDGINTEGLSLASVAEWTLEKERNKDYLGYYDDRFVVGLSSGTSGNRGIYVTPRSLTERLPAVFLARGGLPLSLLPFRILFLLRVFSQGFDDISSPLIKLSYLSTMEPAEKIIASANKLRINVLMAPPSLIRTLLPHIELFRAPIRLLVTYAETLEDEEKDRFEKAFSCRVIQIYQASEGQLGSSCKCGNLHVNEDLVYLELYDSEGKTVSEPGARAESMYVTNLVNTVQPIIRYRMNDLVELGENCPCGSDFRVIRRVLGRHDDVFYLKTTDGSVRPLFPDLVSRWIITENPGVREFRVEQTDASSVSVTLDLLPGAGDPSSAIRSMHERFARELASYGFHANVAVVTAAIELPREMHKYRRFVRNPGCGIK